MGPVDGSLRPEDAFQSQCLLSGMQSARGFRCLIPRRGHADCSLVKAIKAPLTIQPSIK